MPIGASGSSTISANDCVPAGGSFHVSAGEIFFPVHVYLAGMDWPLPNASLLSSIDISASVGSVVGVSFDVHDKTMVISTRQRKKIRFMKYLPVVLHRTAGQNLIQMQAMEFEIRS